MGTPFAMRTIIGSNFTSPCIVNLIGLPEVWLDGRLVDFKFCITDWRVGFVDSALTKANVASKLVAVSQFTVPCQRFCACIA